jgi:hypothetical protein
MPEFYKLSSWGPIEAYVKVRRYAPRFRSPSEIESFRIVGSVRSNPQFYWPDDSFDFLVAEEDTGRKLAAKFPLVGVKPVRIESKFKRLGCLQEDRSQWFLIYAKSVVELDWNRTSFIERIIDGEKHKVVEGLGSIEYPKELKFEPNGHSIAHIRPRMPGKGFAIREPDLAGHDLFEIASSRGAVYCTEKFRVFIEELRPHNICFVEVGEILPF